MGLGITWAIAFLLTEAGAYSYKGCDINVPTSNIISDSCRKHVSRMKHCRVDTSHALKSSPWFRFPYPLQWGTPVFHWKMALVMCAVSLITSVDSVSFCTVFRTSWLFFFQSVLILPFLSYQWRCTCLYGWHVVSVTHRNSLLFILPIAICFHTINAFINKYVMWSANLGFLCSLSWSMMRKISDFVWIC